jgi:AAA domain
VSVESTLEAIVESKALAAGNGYLLDHAEPDELVERLPHSRLVDGAAFVFDAAADTEPVWGDSTAPAHAAGEGLMIVGPQGVGKTTIIQQFARARAGLCSHVLGMPVVPDPRRVLLIAADRPKQARRSFARMVSETDREQLADHLLVWQGPLPFDLAAKPKALAAFATELDVGTILIDSLKDVALDLSTDETGSRVNLAIQETLAIGTEVVVLHHQRKAQQGVQKPKTLDDVYGSNWLTAGMGSVILLWGEPGDLIVELTHLKQPAEPIGPLTLLHDHGRGLTTVEGQVDPLELLRLAGIDGLTATDLARAIYHNEAPNRNQIERARRRLERLVDNGKVTSLREPPPKATNYVLNAPGAPRA